MSAGNEITNLTTAIDANSASADEVTRGLSREQFNWRSEPGVWSIAECLTHLNIVNSLDLAPIEQVIEAGRARGITGDGPFRYGFLSTKFVASQDLPIQIKSAIFD